MSRVITSEAALREIVDPPPKMIAEQAVYRIDDVSRRFLESSPFVLLATASADGTCDVSLRGDPAGSVLVRLRGVTPSLAIEVTVTELFLHCSKAFARSTLWDPSSWPARTSVPSAGQIVRGQHGGPVPAKAIDAMLEVDARVNRY